MEHILVKEDMSAQTNENKSSKKATTKRGTYVSKIGNKKHACYIVITLTWQEKA
jgi:hypothetical protein